MDKILAKKINRMARNDQRMRKSFEKTDVWNAHIDKKNTAELKKIIKQYGWPTIPLVGKKASFNAWLIAQHADHDRNFQENVLRLLTKIDKKQKEAIDRTRIAYLTDRLLVAKKKPQVFGTQFYFDKNRKLKLYPPKKGHGSSINALRKEYGLPTLEFHLKEAKKYNASKKNSASR